MQLDVKKHEDWLELEEKYKIKFVKKNESWFWGVTGKLVKWVTFGGNSTFMANFTTTLGPIVAFPEHVDLTKPPTDRNRVTALHEGVHRTQFKWAGLGSAYLGILPMCVAYLIFLLPVYGAFGRVFLELAAYKRDLVVYGRYFGDGAAMRRIDKITGYMVGPQYGYCLPKLAWVENIIRGSVVKYYEKHKNA